MYKLAEYAKVQYKLAKCVAVHSEKAKLAKVQYKLANCVTVHSELAKCAKVHCPSRLRVLKYNPIWLSLLTIQSKLTR